MTMIVEQICVGIAVVVAAAGIRAVFRGAVLRARRRHHEQCVVRYLREHTEDRPGKQYLPIVSVAQGVGLDVTETLAVADRSPLVLRRKADSGMIGLFEQERSVYEERGLIWFPFH